MFTPIGSPDAWSSEGVDTEGEDQSKISSRLIYCSPGPVLTKGGGAFAAWRAQSSLLLLPKEASDGGLDAFLLAGLVQGVLAAVGAAAVRRQAGREEDQAGGQYYSSTLYNECIFKQLPSTISTMYNGRCFH